MCNINKRSMRYQHLLTQAFSIMAGVVVVVILLLLLLPLVVTDYRL